MLNKWHRRTAILKILILQIVIFGTFYSKDNAKAVQPDQIIQGWGNKCLDVVNNEGKGPRNGTPVVIWDCYGSENQKCKVNSNGTIQGWGNKR
jgi:hypothetical protein